MPEIEATEVSGHQREERTVLTNKKERSISSLTSYLRTEYALWYWAIVFVSAMTTVAVFIIPEGFYPWVSIRYGLGLVYVLGLPGYAFVRALFPIVASGSHSNNRLNGIERIAISIGMSMALVPIIGLLLNYTPWGITIAPIISSVLIFTLLFSTAAMIREYIIRKEDRSIS